MYESACKYAANHVRVPPSIYCAARVCLPFFLFTLGKLMAKQKVALECLSYHATASVDDTVKLTQDTIPSAETYNLYRLVVRVFVVADCTAE